MCILFIYNGSNDAESDYSMILASNRDEFYDRPTQNMAPWSEEPSVIGGRDLEANCGGGTWLAISSRYSKCGVLLNLPGPKNTDAKSRGRIVADFVKCEESADEYIENIKNYAKECNEFIFVSLEFGTANPVIQSFNNVNKQLVKHDDTYLGFGNSLPQSPLKKVEAGKEKMKNICQKYNKIGIKQQLIMELIEFLRSNESHLPDQQLEKSRPHLYQQLSSIFVCIPEGRYGTRTHTLLLVTKSGHADLIEITMQSPIDPKDYKWERTDLQFDIMIKKKLLL